MSVYKRLIEHKESALADKNIDWFVICLQGSQNYGLADEESDIDTKMLTLPSARELVVNEKPYNKVHIMDNDEHCDMKDVREYFKIFRKQNINFVETLFTDYYVVNSDYADLWGILLDNKEELVRYNEYAAISCIKGMAIEKYHALTHEYPSRIKYIEKYGYDPKQLSHLIRLKNFLYNYAIKKKPYKLCLLNDGFNNDYLMNLKRNGNGLSLHEAQQLAEVSLDHIVNTVDFIKKNIDNKPNEKMDNLLNDILYELITRKMKKDLTL